MGEGKCRSQSGCATSRDTRVAACPCTRTWAPSSALSAAPGRSRGAEPGLTGGYRGTAPSGAHGASHQHPTHFTQRDAVTRALSLTFPPFSYTCMPLPFVPTQKPGSSLPEADKWFLLGEPAEGPGLVPRHRHRCSCDTVPSSPRRQTSARRAHPRTHQHTKHSEKQLLFVCQGCHV